MWLSLWVILPAAVLVLLAVAANVIYHFVLVPRRERPGQRAAEDNVVGTTDRAQGAAYLRWFDECTQPLQMRSYDGLQLCGHLAPAPGHCYAVVVHGYRCKARLMAGFGMRFHQRGFSVLMPDCRGHGESEGRYIGMGWHDRMDLLAWIDRLVARDPQARIVLFGVSMGAAAVMMAGGEPLLPQVKLVIEDCGYTSVWEQFVHRLRTQFHAPSFPMMQIVSLVARVRAGYWFGEASAVRQVARCALPVLFIHGEDDAFVPYRMMDALYAAKPGVKAKFSVPGAKHALSAEVDFEGYWEAIDDFIAEEGFLPPHAHATVS